MTFAEVQAALAAATPLVYGGPDVPGLSAGDEVTVLKAADPAFVYVTTGAPQSGPVKVDPDSEGLYPLSVA